MKKLLAIVLALAMLMSICAINVFADADDTKVLLEIGNVFGTLVQSEAIDAAKSGEYTLTATLDSALSTSSDSSYIGVKTIAGNVSQKTALPDGTTITVTSLVLDGEEVALDASKASKTVAAGVFNGNDGVTLLFKMGGTNALTGDVPETFQAVKVTIVVDNPESPEEPEEPEQNVATGYFMMYEGEAPGEWNVANYRFEDGCKTKGESWDMVNITDLVKEAAGGDLSKVIAVDVTLTADGLEKFPSWYSNADQTPVVEYRAYTADNVSALMASVSRADNTSNAISLHAVAYHGLDSKFCVKVRGIEAVSKEEPVKVIVTVEVTTDEKGPYVPSENTVYYLHSVPVQRDNYPNWELINGSTYNSISAFNSALIAPDAKGVIEYTLDENAGWGQVNFQVKVPAHNPDNPEEIKDAELDVTIGINVNAGNRSVDFDYNAIYSSLINTYYTEGGEKYKPGTAYDNQWSGANNYIFDELPEDYVVTLSNVLWQSGKLATITKVEITVPEEPEKPSRENDPTLDNFGSTGWGSSYDAETKTITFEDAWKGRGWWFGPDNPLEDVSSITIKFASNEIGCNLVVQYVDGTSTSTPCDARRLTVTAPIADAPVSQIYIQNRNDAGEIVLESVSVTHYSDVVPVDPENTTVAKTTGYIYVNEDYHGLFVKGHLLVSPHDDNGSGFCPTCRAEISNVEEGDGDDIVIVDPTEPGDVDELPEEPGDITVNEPKDEPKEDKNPHTGVALAVLPMIVAAFGAVASKRR